jgi:hypothetical protein
VYGREYNNEILSFEPSGGLKEASLVMRDRETDSWWSIISGDAIGGTLKGMKLEELPVWEKTTWGEWRERHPNSLVLSVDGVEHDPGNPYQRYFSSDGTFRGTKVKDDRLPGKESIYSFRAGAKAYAAPHDAIVGGAVFDVDGGTVFLYRSPGADMFASTRAYFAPSGDDADDPVFKQDSGGWVASATGARFDPNTGFSGEGKSPERLTGFDTFWYMWSNINDDVVILK